MKPGTGVSGAIFSRADAKALADECLKYVPLDEGQAVLTPSYGLACQSIIHCRGPRKVDRESGEVLARTYRTVLETAEQHSIESIALPAISAGAFGFSLEESAQIGVEAVISVSPVLSSVKTVRFVARDETSAKCFAEMLCRDIRPPQNATPFTIDTKFEPEEFHALRHGHRSEYDEKWSFYYIAPWICVYRIEIRYGECYFWLRFKEQENRAIIDQAWVESSDYWLEDGKAADFIRWLLDAPFNLLSLSANKENLCGAVFWKKRGRLALEGPFYSGCETSLLTADQVEMLGRRLIEVADELRHDSSSRGGD